MGEQVNSSISLYSKENFGILSKNIDGDNESLSVLARNEDKNHFVNFSKFLREKKEELERSKIFSKEKNSDLDFSKIDSKDKEEVIKCRTNFFEGKFLPFLKNPKSKDKVDLDEAKDIDSNNNWDDCFDNKPKSKEYHDLWLRLSKAEAKNILEKSGKKSNNYRNSDSDYGSQVPSEKDRYKNAKRKIEKFKELDLGGESFSVLESEDYSSPDFLTKLNGELGKINSLGKDSNLKKFLDANLKGLCTNFVHLEEDLDGEDISLNNLRSKLQSKLKNDDDIEDSLKKLVNLKKATFKYMFDAAMLDINSCNNKIELSGGFDEQEYDADENENAPDNKKYLGFLVNMLSKLEEQLEKIDINLGGAEQDKEEEETDEKNNQKENVSNENAQKKIFYDPYWYINKINNSEDQTKKIRAGYLKNYYVERSKLALMYEHIDKIDIEKFIDSNIKLIYTSKIFSDEHKKRIIELFSEKNKKNNSNKEDKKNNDELNKIKSLYVSQISNQMLIYKVKIGKLISECEEEINEQVESGKKKCEEDYIKNNAERVKVFELLAKGKEFENNNNKNNFEHMLTPSDSEYFDSTGAQVIRGFEPKKRSQNISNLFNLIKKDNKNARSWESSVPLIGYINSKLRLIEKKFPTEMGKIDKNLNRYFNSNSSLFKSIFSAEEDKKKLDEAKKKEEENKKKIEEEKNKTKEKEDFFKKINADEKLKNISMNLKKRVNYKTKGEREDEEKERKKKVEEEKAKRENEEKEKKAIEEEKIRQAEERSTPEKFLEYLGVKSINELKIKYIDNKKGDKDAEVYKNAFEEFEKRYKELVHQVSDKAGESLKKALEEVGPPKKTIKDFFEPKDSWQIDCLLTMEKRVGYDEYVKITNDDKPNAQRYLKFLCLKNINELDKVYENFKSESNHEDYKKNIEYYKQEYEQVKQDSLYL